MFTVFKPKQIDLLHTMFSHLVWVWKRSLLFLFFRISFSQIEADSNILLWDMLGLTPLNNWVWFYLLSEWVVKRGHGGSNENIKCLRRTDTFLTWCNFWFEVFWENWGHDVMSWFGMVLHHHIRFIHWVLINLWLFFLIFTLFIIRWPKKSTYDSWFIAIFPSICLFGFFVEHFLLHCITELVLLN